MAFLSQSNSPRSLSAFSRNPRTRLLGEGLAALAFILAVGFTAAVVCGVVSG
jgi:hypothetical protein